MDGRDIILLHGKPGSGKSSCLRAATPAIERGTSRSVHHLSVGEYLRSIAQGLIKSEFSDNIIANSSDLGQNKHLPHELVNAVVAECIASSNPAGVIVIDGYPKYEEQIPVLKNNASVLGAKILAITQVVVPDEVSLERITSRGLRQGESKVSIDTARERLIDHSKFAQNTTNVLASAYPYVEVNGNQSFNSVVEELGQAVIAVLTNKS
jgi:adenylate kinase family enzyme